MPRKRTYDEISTASPAPAPQEHGMLQKIRNMWEFASLFEWIVLFGQAAKLPSIDVEDFETECVKPQPSQTLEDIGFRLVNWISSRRDITIENWDEHVRRQYIYKAPNMSHPYGEEEEPKAFRDFHIMIKIRVLHQLTVWTFWNPDKIRQAFPDVKEAEQFDYWQMHPVGWDRDDRTYYYFSGDRLYRRTDPPIPVDKPKPKSTSKKAQAQRRKSRTSKRRKVAVSDEDDTEMGEVDETQTETNVEDTVVEPTTEEYDPEKINTFGGYKFECVAVTLEEYTTFLASLAKTKDLNEQNLRSFVQAEILPALEAQEGKRQRKLEAQLKEIQMAEKMQGAKRSGRLAAKHEREREEAEAAETERKRLATLAEARKEQRRAEQMDNERQSRMMTREQRIKDREMKRVLMEDQLARDAEEAERIETEGVRASRHLKERIEKRKQELEEFEDDEWTFDCSGCHQYGKNFDDGEHSIACERCNVWQHSKCLGITKAAAESEDFHFVCEDCRRKEEEANRPRISLKFRVGQSSSPPQPIATQPAQNYHAESPVKQRLVSVDVPASQLPRPAPPSFVANGQPYRPQNHIQPMQQLPQPQLVAAQPPVPSYATHPIQRLQANGTPNLYASAPTYAPSDRLPGSEQAQNLYNQLTYSSNGVSQPLQPANQAPHLPPMSGFRPSSSHSQTPRPASSHSHANGLSSPVRPRIASPIVNKPTMSPTQGNPEVGPIAGIPGSSPIPQPATLATPHTNGHHANGLTHRTPANAPLARNPSYSFDQQGNRLSMSGLSPTKQRTSTSPVPPPSTVPQKQDSFTTPSSSFNNMHNSRTVSGTPIFPPTENLAPSPHQLNRGPVPTPSKQSPPPPSRPPQLQSFSSGVSHVSSTPNPSQQEQKGEQPKPLPQQQQGTVQ